MYVCICSAVTDREIREAATGGARNVRDLREQLGVAAGCGRCASQAREILASCRAVGDAYDGPLPGLVPASA
jgi:bacterioferritin-associated ferredoxin